MEGLTLQNKILRSLAAENIQLVEWENQLLRRLGYPIVILVISTKKLYIFLGFV